MPDLKDIAEQVQTSENKERVEEDAVRFRMYNGQIRDVISAAIGREFKKPETIRELNARIVPINIIQKIINKLSGVYQQDPTRSPKDRTESDQDLIDLYTEPLKINQKMKFANRFFKLQKHTALDPFIDHAGIPRMRALPSQAYTPIGTDPNEPGRMTAFVKHIRTDEQDKARKRFHVWTDEEFWVIDGEGRVVGAEMAALGNPEGINPFGIIPQTYIPEADDGNLIPISDDDLVNMAITIPLLLTDLAFASKYQLWSILAIIGADSENIAFNPNSIMSLPPGASIEVIKPELDVDKALAMVEQLVGLLLTTKNLSVGSVTGTLSVDNAASGVSKMLDSADTTEDRKDQQAFFENGEKEFWGKFAHSILPIWVASGKVDPEFTGAFSPDFELSIRYADPKPFIGDRDRVELESQKIASGFTTQEMALKVINPELDDEQISALMAEINTEKKARMQDAQKAMQRAVNPEAAAEQMDDDGDTEE